MPELYTHENNPLGIRPVGSLLFKMAVPSIIANVVNALYNIVDQIFIGHKIGMLGNAATNIAFPLTTICLALGLMMGLGAAAGFNLNLGKNDPDTARKYAGTTASSLFISGIIIAVLVLVFLRPLMFLFGATPDIIDYACDYASIIAIGLPFLIFNIGFSPLVRGDGNAMYASMTLVVGAVTNVILDYVFVYIFDWGMKGAAFATIIGQCLGAVLLLIYIRRFKSVRFGIKDFIPRIRLFIRVCQLGFNSFVFQGSMLLVQILVNNLLRSYGAASEYGSEIPIAIVGITAKIIAIYFGIIIGLNQGAQPILSFNYGAQRYRRVRSALKLQMIAATAASVIMFLLMQLFPRQIISVFGSGSDLYYKFAVIYMRGYTILLALLGYQVSASTFFPTIGKAAKGSILSLCKQVFVLVPTILIMTRFFGLTGLIYATPISDAINFVLATVFLYIELKHMPKEDLA